MEILGGLAFAYLVMYIYRMLKDNLKEKDCLQASDSNTIMHQSDQTVTQMEEDKKDEERSRTLDKPVKEDDDVYELNRFLRAQDYPYRGYREALQEVKNGKKVRHWIWYIFPQINGLGRSSYQEFYGIKSLEETRAYLDNKILGERLREITDALLQQEGKTSFEILGSIDTRKVKSCMTLFDIVSPHDIFEKVLDKYYNGRKCRRTLKRFGLIDA